MRSAVAICIGTMVAALFVTGCGGNNTTKNTNTNTNTETSIGTANGHDIRSFTAESLCEADGLKIRLSWQVAGIPTLSIDQEVGTVTGTSTTVPAPTSIVTYTLTAVAADGTLSKRSVQTEVASLGPSFSFPATARFKDIGTGLTTEQGDLQMLTVNVADSGATLNATNRQPPGENWACTGGSYSSDVLKYSGCTASAGGGTATLSPFYFCLYSFGGGAVAGMMWPPYSLVWQGGGLGGQTRSTTGPEYITGS